MLSALLMLRRVARALRADPDLVLDDGWLNLFTVLYQLIGMGILVEILRRLGMAFVSVQAQDRAE